MGANFDRNWIPIERQFIYYLYWAATKPWGPYHPAQLSHLRCPIGGSASDSIGWAMGYQDPTLAV